MKIDKDNAKYGYVVVDEDWKSLGHRYIVGKVLSVAIKKALNLMD
ncbi:hypothetical protein [Lactiplantibacillus plantarum]|nr:hypothetical protein [Lactiplantibacillus plantarum]